MYSSIGPNVVSSDIPLINPSDYLSALKTQSNLPVLIVKKLSSIVQDYYNIRPQLTKKQNQMKMLYMYNQKLLATIETFITHQKKITEKYNTLASMYIKSFKKYCDSKNWQVNFSSLKPIHSLFQTFSMKQWKFQIPNNENITIKKSYQEMLMNTIKKYFINCGDFLQKTLDTVISGSSFSQDKQKRIIIQQIKANIKELNSAEITTENMFDVLQKRKEIQISIQNLNDKNVSIFMDKDLNFIDQITKLHTRLLTTHPEELKDYLQREKEIWEGLKKKSKECRNILDDYFQKIQTQNNDLKEELDGFKKKLTDVEAERNQFRSKFQYLQLKQGSSSKRERGINSNSSFFDQSRSQDIKGPSNIKQLNKKLELRIGQLQREIKQLKKDIEEKEEAHRHLPIPKELMNSNTEMEDLRLKLCSKLMEMGINDTESLTSGEMLDVLLQKISGYKRYEGGVNCSDYIDIKITQSIPYERMKKCMDKAMQIPLQHDNSRQQSNLRFKPQSKREEEPSVKEVKQVPNSFISDSKSYFESKIVKDKDTAVDSQLRVTGREQKDQKQRESLLVENKMFKKSAIVFRSSAYELNSIQQRKSLEQESKMGDASKMMKERSINDQRFSLLKEEIDEIKHNSRLKDQNALLNRQIINLKEQIKRLEQKLIQKEKAQSQRFSSWEITGDHAFQIESVCHTLAKQLSKVEGNQFQKTLTSIDEALKQIKLGITTNLAQRAQQDHFNQIPVLSKMMNDQSDLLRSETIINMICGRSKEEEPKIKVRKCSSNIQKGEMLTLKSKEIEYKIKLQKSYYFGNKQSAQNKHLNYSMANPSKSMVPVVEQDQNTPKRSISEIKADQDELINIVNNFENTSRIQQKSKNRNYEHSLMLSQSNLKNSYTSKQLELRQLRQIKDQIRPIDKKLAEDIELLKKLEQKLSEIKNDSEHARDLYWFYHKYKQTYSALERSEAIVRSHEKRKQACTKKLTANDSSLSRYKLEETIYFLQQRVNELQDLLQVHKNQYQSHITEQLNDIAELKQTTLDSLVRGVLTKTYLQFSGGRPFQR